MEAIDKIHEFQRFGSILGLERMTVLLELLGNPQDDLKVIHVAGTNGKGSICKYVYEVLQAGGYKTGLYTSPYLEVFNERIEFDGRYISNEDLDKYTKIVLAKVDEMIAAGNDSPTEFEVITAVALLYFKEKNCDYAVLEVGLGGRGDSTNVVKKPLACIIGSISLDHTDRLGDTIAKIAAEKAGIIKDGCPVVSGADNDDAKGVIAARAGELSAPYYDSTETSYKVERQTLEGCIFSTEILGKMYQSIEIAMIGEHQVRNAMAALTAVTLMMQEDKVKLTDDAIYKGMKKAKQIGRFEIMKKDPYVIIDGAHNPDGARALRETIAKQFPEKKILMVVGVLADKDVDSIVEIFGGVTKDFVATEPDNPRKMVAKDLAARLTACGGRCITLRNPKDAVNMAKECYNNYDLVIFAGSLYLIGEIRGLLRNEQFN